MDGGITARCYEGQVQRAEEEQDMTDVQRRAAAKQFAADWQGRGDEKQETQGFWLSLLQKVFGVEEPEKFISFELPVKLSHTSFIDGYIEQTRVLIEQKGCEIDLRKGYKQSDGSLLRRSDRRGATRAIFRTIRIRDGLSCAISRRLRFTT